MNVYEITIDSGWLVESVVVFADNPIDAVNQVDQENVDISCKYLKPNEQMILVCVQ